MAPASDSGEICVPSSRREGSTTFGAEVLRNPSGDDAVITGAETGRAKGVELVGAVVVDLDGSSSVGARTSWPPSGQENTPQWKAAVPADGAIIPAGSTHQKNLVLHRGRRAGPPRLGSYTVAYELTGTSTQMQTTFALQIMRHVLLMSQKHFLAHGAVGTHGSGHLLTPPIITPIISIM